MFSLDLRFMACLINVGAKVVSYSISIKNLCYEYIVWGCSKLTPSYYYYNRFCVIFT